ncbi:MAG: hypothetical protein AAFX99_33985 [Myxococcota bacterium]
MLAPKANGIEHLPRCTPATAVEADFIDGGVFDNQPLNIIMRSATLGLERTPSRWAWRTAPNLERAAVPKEMVFFAMNPEVRAWPRLSLSDSPTPQPREALSAMVSHFAATFVNTARTKELQELLVANPELRDQMALGRNYLPQASSPMWAFFGFFDRGLREYDFHLGMADAYLFIREQGRSTLEAGTDLRQIFRLPEPEWPNNDPNTLPDDWKPFYCILGHIEANASMQQACSGDDMHNTRALLQVSLDQLYDVCRHFEPDQRIDHHQCSRARDGEEPPRVAKVYGDDTPWTRGEEEPDYAYVLRRLAAYHYAFKDLGLRRDEADKAPRMIRNQLLEIGKRLAEVNDEGETFINTLVHAGVNAISYAPPQNIVYVALGSNSELGFSSRWPGSEDTDWLRLHAALSIVGLPELSSSESGALALAPTLGLEFEPTFLNSSALQVRLGLRGGTLLSTGDDFFSGSCDFEETGDTLTACSRLLTQSFLSLSVYERIRVQFTGTWSPAVRTREEGFWAVTPSLGFQFYNVF